MVEIVWTKSAVDGLDDVAEFIAIDNLSAAKRVVEEITNSIDRCKTFQKVVEKYLKYSIYLLEKS